jgi:hypothetical protein
MITSWVLVTPQKKPLLISENRRQLKFVQLIVAKYHTIELIVSQTPEVVITPANLELHKKLQFVKNVLDTEDDAIIEMHHARENTAYKENLKTVGEFYSLIFPDDPSIPISVKAEIEEVDRYKASIDVHRSFIFKNLYQLDYRQDLDTIKQTFRNLLVSDAPSDDYYVYEELQLPLVTKFDSGLL